MKKGEKRLTIGLFVSGITESMTQSLCIGAIQQARAEDVNLVIFPGKYLGRDLSSNPKLMYEYQYNTLFEYAKSGKLDGLIIAAGSIGCFLSAQQLQAFLDQYRELPCVLLSAKANGFPDVCFDNYEGIREGIEQLMRQQGCRKFAMLGGNAGNNDSLERKASFISVLASHGIPFEEKMFAETDLSRNCQSQAAKLLDNNPGVEAVFCVNDDIAFGFYEEAKRRGLQIGKDIFVFGYDDGPAAALASPPLSSVRADVGSVAQEALKAAVRLAAGERIHSVVLPTHFIRRDSTFQEENANGPRRDMMLDLYGDFSNIYFRYEHEGNPQQVQDLRLAFTRFIMSIRSAFQGKEKECPDSGRIYAALEQLFRLGGMKYADTDCFLTVLEKEYRDLYHRQENDKERFDLRNIFAHIYRKIIREMNRETGIENNRRDSENYEMKIFVQEMLQFERGSDQSYSSLLENLDWLKIKNACVYIFPKHLLHLQKDDFVVPAELDVKAVLKNGTVSTPSLLRQKTELLFSESLLPDEEQYSRILLPLFFKENLYGVLLCDMTDALYTNGEFLINQLGSAVKMISLLQANEQAQQQLEETISTLKEHNIELDLISRIDPLTGILNRRGFNADAESFLRAACREGSDCLTVYVDMNNLKIINDRYGHEEGDSSLKLIGSTLNALVASRGIAGRIGGDEYACVLKGMTEEAFLSELYGKFEAFNRTSDKPYTVTVSAGAHLVDHEHPQSLADALFQADEHLYEAKKFRKKEVAKENAEKMLRIV